MAVSSAHKGALITFITVQTHELLGLESGEVAVLPRPGSAGHGVIPTTSLHTWGCPLRASPCVLSTFGPIAPCSRRKPVEMPSVGFGTLWSPLGPATGELKRWSKGEKEVSEIRRFCFLLKAQDWWILRIKGHYSLQDRLCMSLSFRVPYARHSNLQ